MMDLNQLYDDFCERVYEQVAIQIQDAPWVDIEVSVYDYIIYVKGQVWFQVEDQTIEEINENS
jgi:hypothetical protein